MNQQTALEILKILKESGEITEETRANAARWLTDPEYKGWREEILAMLRPAALIDTFYTVIPFGTGGRRGLVGVGTNRMNERTIGESAQGLAQYILDADKTGRLAKKGVAVAYDVRTHSKAFSQIVASVLAGNGVKTFLFESPRATPELSFAVRHLGCAAGVVITASHNPPTDNGFKAYWTDGGQVVAPHDTEILKRVMAAGKIRKMPFAKAKKEGLIEVIGKEVDEAYFKLLKAQMVLCEERDARIVYTPLHGTGVTIVPRALAELGFKDVLMPPDQVRMDGTFPTVPNNYPNPEEPAAMTRAVEFARANGGDVVLATDPDSDRLGVFAPDGKGDFVYMTGNEMGALMCHFTLAMKKARGELPKKPFVLTTLVSTQLVRAICEDFRVRVVDDLLVGFKNMAAVLAEEEAKGGIGNFVYSFEESIGFMRGTFVRDKDAASAAVTCAQMAAHLKTRGMTMHDSLDELFRKYGYFREDQFSVFLRGEDGMKKMAHIMETLRTKPPKKVGTLPVLKVIDRKAGTMTDTASGAVKRVKGTKGDVMQFWFDETGRTRLTVRPSGTEPKIKHYAAAFAPVSDESGLENAKKIGNAVIAELIGEMKALEAKITG